MPFVQDTSKSDHNLFRVSLVARNNRLENNTLECNNLPCLLLAYYPPRPMFSGQELDLKRNIICEVARQPDELRLEILDPLLFWNFSQINFMSYILNNIMDL